MNERELAILLIGAALPVVLPILLRSVGSAAASADTSIEKNEIIKELVDKLAVPVMQKVLDEIKVDRSQEPAPVA